MNTQELFEQIENLYEDFKAGHEGSTKAAHGRARKALGEIKKLVTEYRKASVAEDKKQSIPLVIEALPKEPGFISGFFIFICIYI